MESLCFLMRSLDVELQDESADYTYVNFSGALADIKCEEHMGERFNFEGIIPFECGERINAPAHASSSRRASRNWNCSNTSPIAPCNYPITATPLNPLQNLGASFYFPKKCKRSPCILACIKCKKGGGRGKHITHSCVNRRFSREE